MQNHVTEREGERRSRAPCVVRGQQYTSQSTGDTTISLLYE